MKFDPLVKSENNKLYRLSDGEELSLEKLNAVSLEKAVSGTAEIPEDEKTVTVVTIKWSEIEMAPESYNEESLASLREYLKKLQDKGRFAFIEASSGRSFKDADDADSFIKCMVHTARRIKDAESVVGFSIADELLEKDGGSGLGENSWSQWFVNEMNVKHGHYVYFASKKAVQKNALDAEVSKTAFILY